MGDWTPCCGPVDSCSYDQCTSDSDCNAGAGVCVCRDVPFNTWGTQNVCLNGGNCHSDTDCTSGYCSPSADPAAGKTSWTGYFCHGPGDECVNDRDCGDGGTSFCAFDPAKKHWTCSNSIGGADAS
jgi:hypothetical protein